MKITNKLVTKLVLLNCLLFLPSAKADVSATAGFVSDYYFRGSNLGDGGAYASIDYSNGGFSAGSWWIDDGSLGNDGLETDFYFSYAKSHDQFSWSVGYTRYEYTYSSDFEHEVALNLSTGNFSFDVIKGVDDDQGINSEDYSVLQLGYSKSYFGLTLGTGDYDDLQDSSWSWLEISFSGELVEGISTSLNIGVKTDDAAGTQDDGYIYLDISKAFDL
ncbi:MAG: hypothetical protein OQJ89_04475 [Kangiellaceae bacterium]|nr:hypothetical protein [Kangiellaceae bacterium]MCW8997483.1 hypothetical protein [Kangiellaceae bacterium]MCW9016198.1 hypothetical protein [Kangiellaceae bacterium]